MWRIRLAAARDAAHWGEVTDAVARLETLAREARAERVGEVRAAAAHELGNLLVRVGEPERAARLLYDALMSYGPAAVASGVHRSWLGARGARVSGRGAGGLWDSELTDGGVEQQVAATLELLRLSVVEGDRPLFRRHRAELRRRELSAGEWADYYYIVGEGCRRFGRPEKAVVAFTRARRAARAAGKPRLAAASTAALATETLCPPPPRRPSAGVAADVRAIAAMVGELAAAAPAWCRGARVNDHMAG